MALVLDDQQLAIQREAERIVAETSDTARLLALLDRPGSYDEKLAEVAFANGWTAIAVPEAHGGLGLGLSEVGLICQALGRAPTGMPFVTSNYALSMALELCGDADAAPSWRGDLASGASIGTVALGEPYDPLPATPRVTFRDGVLHGTKPAVLAGAWADSAVVLARGDAGPVLVMAALCGLDPQPIASSDPARGHADLVFDGTPATLAAQGEAALRIARDVLARMAVACAYEQLGGAAALMLLARDYAKTRKAFGQPIGAFQAVKHRIAELYALVEIARGNCAAAAEAEGNSGFHAAAAAARLAATEAYDTAARDCVQIHGGIGVTWELGLHLHMRRARSLANELGNALFWEDWLVDELVA